MKITDERLLLFLLIANILLCLIFLLYEHLHARNRNRSLLLFSFMLLCPLAGPFFLGAGYLFARLFFRKNADLSAISFSKERIKILEQPDIEEELNIVPLQEAMLIEDKNNLRRLMLNILRNDFSQSLPSIASALSSEDSEASHYAASAIMDITSAFRNNLQNYYKEFTENPRDAELGNLLLEYMYRILRTGIFSDVEKASYVFTMQKCCELFYENNRKQMEARCYSWITQLLTDIQEYEQAKIWAERLMENHPRESESYRCCLRLYYTIHDNDSFLQCLNKLKSSSIPIEQDLLDMIRFYT